MKQLRFVVRLILVSAGFLPHLVFGAEVVFQQEIEIKRENFGAVQAYVHKLRVAFEENESIDPNVSEENAQIGAELQRVLKKSEGVFPHTAVDTWKSWVPKQYGGTRAEKSNSPSAQAVAAIKTRFAISPLNYGPTDVASYIKRQQSVIREMEAERKRLGRLEGNAFREFYNKEQTALSNIVGVLSLVRTSPWKPKEVIEFRRLLTTSTNGVLNEDLLQERLRTGWKPWEDKIRVAVYSFESWGSMSASLPLVSVKSNTVAEVAGKILELRDRFAGLSKDFTQIKPKVQPFGAASPSPQGAARKRTKSSTAPAASNVAAFPDNYWEAVIVGEELVRVVQDAGKNGKKVWTLNQMNEFLEKLRGADGKDFGALFDAKQPDGDPVFDFDLRDVLETHAATLLVRGSYPPK